MCIRSSRNETGEWQRSANDTSSPSPYQQQDVARLMDDPRDRRSVKQGNLSTSWEERVCSGRIIMGLKQLGGMVKDLVQRDILQEPRTCSATYFAPEEPVISKGPTIIRLGLSANLTLTKARRCQWMASSGRQSGVVVRSKRVKLGCRCAIALFGDTHA